MAANLFGKCRKILAIGRNYKLHAEELGNKVSNGGCNPSTV
jgi:2-keto-4-pentenoate hydratase/2-oxohepta-3-ene-1,7-dioic acid hydratase in catechol pathway